MEDWMNGETSGEYPREISGFRFLERRELPPASTGWDFQATRGLSLGSARRLFINLPMGFQLEFFDPHAHSESWLVVRREGDALFVTKFGDEGGYPYKEQALDIVVSLFLSSPLVKEPPPDSIPSFTVSSIPGHQMDWHKKTISK